MDAFEAVSLPELCSDSTRKFFSVAEANRALPLVRRIVADIVRDYRRLRELHDTCRAFDQRGRTADAEETRQKYVSTTDHLTELRDELEQIGCTLKDYNVGLVDFPSRFEGREIYLCWKHGEDKVCYWHEITTGVGGRQPVTEEIL